MKRSSLIALALSLLPFATSPAIAQNSAPDFTRPRTVTNPSTQAVKDDVVIVPVDTATETKTVHSAEANPNSRLATVLTPQLIRSRISEAERLLKSHPKQTALATSPSIEFVTLATLERTTGHVHLLNISKETFLTKGSEITLPSSLGTLLTLRVLRANGVNTAVTVTDQNNQPFVPLVVEFPIERRGVFREMAYYTSAHPALLSADLTKTGRTYVRNMLDLAAQRLQEKGNLISPQIIDVAERLCLVEHVDHTRFRAENRAMLLDEIYSLYALNEIDTYRYSVSFAGAGGMVQMIPWAYNLMRQRHPAAGLNPDFVTGMRNHANALQAMLLYMQDTWNDLSANEDVQYALSTKTATPPELLAAGYNSNAAKLPGYIRRGGAGWKMLIPRETQMYLQIYKAVDTLVPMKSRVSTPTTVASN